MRRRRSGIEAAPSDPAPVSARRRPAHSTPPDGPRAAVLDAVRLPLHPGSRIRPLRPWPVLTGAVVAALLLLGAAAPAPLGAERLLLRDGGSLELAGAWHVEGARVVFHLPDGRLSSLPTSAVDLVGSAAATSSDPRAAAPMRRAAPSRARSATWVITDRDVGHLPPSTSSAGPAAAPALPAGAAPDRPGAGVAPLRGLPAETAGAPVPDRQLRRVVYPPSSLPEAMALMKALEPRALSVCMIADRTGAAVACAGSAPTPLRAAADGTASF